MIEAPTLDHDTMMLVEYGRQVSANGRLERRIVANLFAHLASCNWFPVALDDGDTTTEVASPRAVMELMFNLDLCRVTMANGDTSHAILFVLGNGRDIIADYSSYKNDRDGFNAAMEAFDTGAF